MEQGKPVILCVDDEENSLFLRKLVLQKSGYEVITARSGREALEILESRSFDLMLSDLLMPEMSGAELTRHVKDRHPRLPVILISGVNEFPPEAQCADLLMNKVEGPAKLCENIAAVLKRLGLPRETSEHGWV